MSSDPIRLDPKAVLDRYQARIRQHLNQAAQREASLLEEISNLEAYIAQLQEQLAAGDTQNVT